jgi:hypothetical protein
MFLTFLTSTSHFRYIVPEGLGYHQQLFVNYPNPHYVLAHLLRASLCVWLTSPLALLEHVPEHHQLRGLRPREVSSTHWLHCWVCRIDCCCRLYTQLQAAAPDFVENTLFLVVGDHGETFGQHGHYQHGSCAHDECLRVALMLWKAGASEPALVAWINFDFCRIWWSPQAAGHVYL